MTDIIAIPERTLQRLVTAIALLLAVATLVLEGRQSTDPEQQARLRQLFPKATGFSPKEGQPPRYTAYTKGTSGARTVLGYAYWTTDLVPLERGYGGPIAILVGIDVKGLLTGVVVGEHQEPYGDFSIDPPEFAAQFRNKDVRDPFRLGDDVDAVSRATITMSSAVRAIRNASRQIARSLLTPPSARR